MKLSARLNAIFQKVERRYDHIWDTCCDHGYLGMALMEQHPESLVHFVDINETIIKLLNQRIVKDTQAKNWRSHTLSVFDLPIAQFTGKHLIIIAGVGGDLVSEMMTALINHNQHKHCEFLICPIHHCFKVRKTLKQCRLRLIDESLITENGRYYEVMHVGYNRVNTSSISEVGDKLWQCTEPHQRTVLLNYLNKLITHYTKLAESRKDPYEILPAYRQKLKEVTDNIVK